MCAAHPDASDASSHQSGVPEVTFCIHRIAKPSGTPQHGGMRNLLRHLLQPLHLALLITWTAVALSMQGEPSQYDALRWGLMLLFLSSALLCDLPPTRPWRVNALLVAEALAALALVWLAPRNGATPVLLVVVVAQLGMMWPLRRTLLAMLVLNLAFYLLLRAAGYSSPALVVLIYGGFQAFALLIGHYASTAERARDQLALVNADLLATRALLADSARDAERLRVARELHDVAGHKLTAMKLNLRTLAGLPEFAGRADVALVQQLSTELLEDIRSVVQALRDTRGLDLETALRALAAPLPKPRLHLHIADDVQVGDPALAETLLRLVQEALTNAARHADAEVLSVALTREGRDVVLRIEDDGSGSATVREGNGLTGMRERIAAAHGSFARGTTALGGFRIEARLPA